jgi:hypothetical protein
MVNISSIVACYRTSLQWFYFAVTLLNAERPSYVVPPSYILQEAVEEAIKQYGINNIKPTKRRLSNDSAGAKKRQCIKYDRQRAFDCVTSNWMSPACRFPDKQFERAYGLKRSMVDYIIGHLANRDVFWTQTIDAVGQRSIHPHVKFLAAQKLMCYGVSFTAFQDYFQMGESTARWCVKN